MAREVKRGREREDSIRREMKKERKESRIDFFPIGAIMTRHRTDQNKKLKKSV